MVLLQRGGQWNDESLSLTFASGVTVGAYGEPSLPRPFILHSLPAMNRPTRCVQAFNAANITFTDLHVAGCASHLSLLQGCSVACGVACARASPFSSTLQPPGSCYEGISLRFTAANMSNILVKNCAFADIRQPYSAYQSSGGSWARAIAIDGAPVCVPIGRCVSLLAPHLTSCSAPYFILPASRPVPSHRVPRRASPRRGTSPSSTTLPFAWTPSSMRHPSLTAC